MPDSLSADTLELVAHIQILDCLPLLSRLSQVPIFVDTGNKFAQVNVVRGFTAEQSGREVLEEIADLVEQLPELCLVGNLNLLRGKGIVSLRLPVG